MAWTNVATAGNAATSVDELTGYVAVPQIWDGVAEAFLIAPSGSWFAASWAGSKDVKIVDMASGTILRRLFAAGGTIRAGLITQDSKVIVVELYDGRLLAWRAETGQPEVAPRELSPLQPFEGGAAVTQKNPFDLHWTSDSDGRWIIDVGGGRPAMKPVRLVLDDVQSAVDTPCGTEPSAAAFDGKHLLVSGKGGDDALVFAIPAAGFELRDGVFHKLWQAPCDPSGGEVAADPRYFSDRSPAPVGPLTIWDLQTNQILARFADSDGVFAMTADGRVVVTTALEHETTKLFRVSSSGRRTALPRRIDDIAELALSPNGRWLAAKTRPDRTDTPDSVAVLSMANGRQTKTVAAPSASVGIASFKVTNDGDVSVAFTTGEDPSEEIDGRQVVARSADRRWAELSDGKSEPTFLILDTRRHRMVARLHDLIRRFTPDGRYAVTAENVLFDLAAERPVRRIQGTPAETGYVMLFADGCVQVSPGAEHYLKLVRGFTVRPYDATAARLFAKPGCKGRQTASASSPRP